MKKLLSKGRGVLFLLLVVLFVFTLNSFSSLDIEKTAIIIALGIDREQEDYVVTCQLALPSPDGGGDAPQQTPNMISGKGPTPAAAYNEIATLTGWMPTLSFCTVIVLGNEIIERPLMDVLDFSLRVKQLNDACLLCAFDGNARDFFNVKTPLDQISAFSILKVFAKENTQSSDVSVQSLKDFAMNYYRQGNGNFMPYVTALPDQNPENKAGSQNSKSEIMDFAANRIVTFNQDEKKEIFSPELSKSFVLLTRTVKSGSVNLQNVETAQYTAKNLEVNLESSPAKISVKPEKDELVCTLSFEAKIRILHLETDNRNIQNLVDAKIPCEIKSKLKETLLADFTALCDRMKELNCDLLQIEESFYKSHPKEYRKYLAENGQHNVLSHTRFEIKVDVKAKD